MKRFGLLVVTLALLAAGRASAQSVDEGLLNAVAYKPLPAGMAIAVRPMDDSDENLVLRERIEGELKAQGFSVSGDGALILTFETRDSVGAWSDAGRRSVLEFQYKSEKGIGGDNERLRLNLFDSAKGGVFNEGRAHGTSIVTPSQYRIDATIDDRRNGERLWQAWATASLQQSDGPTLTQAMVPAMVESLGKTVRRQTFQLP
ncbi:MAG: hypothetical protein QF830_01680 [Rhodospirillales bacterium]|nr:hypothetical protein [Rhodospirillales bacterium]MDP6882822.1 hypothetical protein [Rhodospirillales bacterium]